MARDAQHNGSICGPARCNKGHVKHDRGGYTGTRASEPNSLGVTDRRCSTIVNHESEVGYRTIRVVYSTGDDEQVTGEFFEDVL